MSNVKKQNNGKPVNNGAADEPAKTPEKKGLLTKIYDGYQKAKAKVMSTKGGRIVAKAVKGIAVGGGLYGAYRLGQKSVKPTQVVIESGESGVQEEKPDVTDESVEETTEEEINEEHD